jgi:hypothetical protein
MIVHIHDLKSKWKQIRISLHNIHPGHLFIKPSTPRSIYSLLNHPLSRPSIHQSTHSPGHLFINSPTLPAIYSSNHSLHPPYSYLIIQIKQFLPEQEWRTWQCRTLEQCCGRTLKTCTVLSSPCPALPWWTPVPTKNKDNIIRQNI